MLEVLDRSEERITEIPDMPSNAENANDMADEIIREHVTG